MARITLLILLLLTTHTRADILTLADGRTLEGEITSESDAQIVLRMHAGSVTLARKDVVSIERKPFSRAPATSATGARGRLPDAKSTSQVLRRSPWSKNIRQIPATLLTEGPAREIPYLAYRAAEDYEINIYGDPAAPVAIEIGLRNMLARSDKAKANARAFIAALLSDPEDRAALDSLKTSPDKPTDKKVREGLTFEIRPAGPQDSGGAWWIWVYDDRTMNLQRAGEDELKQLITTRRARTVQRPTRPSRPGRIPDPPPVGGEPWTQDDLRYARRPAPPDTKPRVFVRENLRAMDRYIPANLPQR